MHKVGHVLTENDAQCIMGYHVSLGVCYACLLALASHLYNGAAAIYGSARMGLNHHYQSTRTDRC